MKSTCKKFALVLLFISVLTPLANSQDSWSLEQCIAYAFENNIQLKQQVLNVQTGENRLLQSKLSHLPNLNANANHSYNFGRAIDYGTNSVSNDLSSTSMSISSSVTLFGGFQITNTRKQNALDLQASISDVEKLKNSISLNIAAAYLQILFYEELMGSAKEQVELSLLQREKTSILVRAGSVAEGNLLEIEAQLASDELQLINNQNQLDLAYLNLAQMLDLKTTDNFRIQKPNLQGFEDIAPKYTTSELFEASAAILPQIKSANLRMLSAEKGLQIARGGLYPRLSMNANYGSGVRMYLKENPPILTNDPYGEQLKQNASVSIGASLSIPIFNSWQIRTNVANARINSEMARLNLENEKNMLFKEIQQSFADATAALKKYQVTNKSLVALQESYRYTEQKYGLGMVTTLDYTTAKTRLAKAETELLQAKYEFIFKSKILDFYRGNPITL